MIYQTAEDGLGDTVKPRLLEAGADLDRVMVLDDGDKPLTLSDKRLDRAIRENHARLLIIDPVQAFSYIAGWSAAKETPELKASLQTIRQASSEMITAIDQEMEKLRSMRNEQNMDSISYRLYQLKGNLETTGSLHFMVMNYLKRQGMAVEGQNYALVYSGDTQ